MNNDKLIPDRRFEIMAEVAAASLLAKLGITRAEVPDTLIIAGTGWGDVIAEGDMESVVSRERVDGFTKIENAPGHAGTFGIAIIGGKRVAVTNGRVHMWQSAAAENPRHVTDMVRLQHEMWAVLGVKYMIATCGAGSLNESLAPEGTVVVMSDIDHGDIPLPFSAFVTPGAPINPLQEGVFTLKAVQALHALNDGWVHVGPHKVVLGPAVESLQRKLASASQGFVSIGMSVPPAAAIAHLYGMGFIAVALMTNGMVEVLDGKANGKAGRSQAARLHRYLGALVNLFPEG